MKSTVAFACNSLKEDNEVGVVQSLWGSNFVCGRAKLGNPMPGGVGYPDRGYSEQGYPDLGCTDADPGVPRPGVFRLGILIPLVPRRG